MDTISTVEAYIWACDKFLMPLVSSQRHLNRYCSACSTCSRSCVCPTTPYPATFDDVITGDRHLEPEQWAQRGVARVESVQCGARKEACRQAGAAPVGRARRISQALENKTLQGRQACELGWREEEEEILAKTSHVGGLL